MIDEKILIDRSIKNMGKVHPLVSKKAKEVISQSYREQIPVQISSGFRTFSEQAVLFGQGRPGYVWKGKNYGKSGKIVTHAEPGQSVHNYGLAIDYFIVSKDGREALWEVNQDWKKTAQIAKNLGFSWGGDWSSFKDFPHLELTQGLSWRELSEGKRPAIIRENSEIPIQQGSHGPEVRKIQELLISQGYRLPKFGSDGIYGAETVAAVKQFQHDHKLKEDGRADKRTILEIENADKFYRGIPLVDYPDNPLQLGSRGKDVERIQRAVKTAPDGIFGEKTKAAVRAYQERHHLQVDGIVGKNTWNMMF